MSTDTNGKTVTITIDLETGTMKFSFDFDVWGLVLFLLVDRKNLPAVLLATGFAICHLIFAFVDFI